MSDQQKLTAAMKALGAPSSASADGVEFFKMLSLGTAAVAEAVLAEEGNPDRRARMERIVAEKRVLQASALDLPQEAGLAHELARHTETLEQYHLETLLLELYYVAPFAPYEVHYTPLDQSLAVEKVIEALGLDPELHTRLDGAVDRARATHHGLAKLGKGQWAAVVGGACALMALPHLAPAIGAMHGLSGAAASAKGMAILGGGSIATGGYGMAGGKVVLFGSARIASLSIAAGRSGALAEVGAGVIEHELKKIQSLIDGIHRNGVEHRAELQRCLEEELAAAQLEYEREVELNDPGSSRLKALEHTMKAFTRAHEWSSDPDKRAMRTDAIGIAAVGQDLGSDLKDLAKTRFHKGKAQARHESFRLRWRLYSLRGWSHAKQAAVSA